MFWAQLKSHITILVTKQLIGIANYKVLSIKLLSPETIYLYRTLVGWPLKDPWAFPRVHHVILSGFQGSFGRYDGLRQKAHGVNSGSGKTSETLAWQSYNGINVSNATVRFEPLHDLGFVLRSFKRQAS